MKYKEANWDQIKKDLENTLTTINNIYEKSDTNILWNTFKNDIINSIESNIPVLFVLYVSVFYTLKDFGFSSCGICSFYL
jgi:uracil DNA glycosylase